QVYDVEARFLARRDVTPGHVLRDLRGIGAALAVEQAKRLQLAAAPLRDRFDRIVDRRVDMLADELHRDVTAALERHIDELGADELLERDRDDLVFLL